MKKEQIAKIADKKGVGNPALFIAFISKRFPKEMHEPYVEEWAERFLTGNPLPYMDELSKRAYLECIKEYKGEM